MHCCSGKAMSIKYSECISVALGIQHAMRMRHIVICGLLGTTIFFSKLSHKRQDFRKKKHLLNTECVLILSTNLSETFLILRRSERDIKKEDRTSCKVPVILVRF